MQNTFRIAVFSAVVSLITALAPRAEGQVAFNGAQFKLLHGANVSLTNINGVAVDHDFAGWTNDYRTGH